MSSKGAVKSGAYDETGDSNTPIYYFVSPNGTSQMEHWYWHYSSGIYSQAIRVVADSGPAIRATDSIVVVAKVLTTIQPPAPNWPPPTNIGVEVTTDSPISYTRTSITWMGIPSVQFTFDNASDQFQVFQFSLGVQGIRFDPIMIVRPR